MLSLVTGGVLSAVTPWIHRKLDTAGKEKISDAFRLIIKALVIMTLVFLSAVPEIFRFIGRDSYYSALGAIYPVAVSVIFIFMSNVYSSIIMHMGRPSAITVNSVISALCSIVIGYLMIKKLGYIGGAYSSLISYALLFLLNRSSARHLSDVRLLNLRDTLTFLVIIIAFLILLLFIREFRLSRILVMIALVLSAMPLLPKCKSLLTDASK